LSVCSARLALGEVARRVFVAPWPQ
jgi:hypothetical protein